jgi:hypothetical protein
MPGTKCVTRFRQAECSCSLHSEQDVHCVVVLCGYTMRSYDCMVMVVMMLMCEHAISS